MHESNRLAVSCKNDGCNYVAVFTHYTADPQYSDKPISSLGITASKFRLRCPKCGSEFNYTAEDVNELSIVSSDKRA